ncbi:MAG: hypothetical protein WBV84_11995 [Nitrososphaeraceae archaeon]
MPLKNLVSIAEASKELKNWLERMNRNEITMIERKEINVELTNAFKLTFSICRNEK